MQAIKERLKDAMKAAMKSGEKLRLGTIRMIMAAIKQIEVDERIVLDDDRVITVLDKMLKQRRESIKQFRAAQREDLAEVEEAEIRVIQDFLPAALSDAEIDGLVQNAVTETGAVAIKDMGKVMGLLRPKMLGRADMSVVSAKIKALLAAK